ncbi:uncharacterized protein LOC109425904 [Aedes albopictus]|uniref:DUF4806 domain-containing protein n=1 Tax=Aedes albopictus TaxID=7160 RepID=A0ABM1YB84_AEDAL
MFTVVQFIENQKFKVMAVPTKWVNKSFLLWPKLANAKIENLRLAGQDFEGATKKIPVIVCGRFNDIHLAEKAAEEPSKREVSDIDGKEKRMKPAKKPKATTEKKNYNTMIEGASPETMVDAGPIYLQGENIVYIQPSDENDIPGMQIAGSMSYEQMKAELKVFIEETVDKSIEKAFQTNFARYAALSDIQAKEDTVNTKPDDTVERHEPIDNEDELSRWNITLNNKELQRRYLEYFSKIIIPNAYNQRGDNACYTVVDCLFTREFWTKMTWTGISRRNKSKRGFHEYGNVVQLLGDIVRISGSRDNRLCGLTVRFLVTGRKTVKGLCACGLQLFWPVLTSVVHPSKKFERKIIKIESFAIPFKRIAGGKSELIAALVKAAQEIRLSAVLSPKEHQLLEAIVESLLEWKRRIQIDCKNKTLNMFQTVKAMEQVQQGNNMCVLKLRTVHELLSLESALVKPEEVHLSNGSY